MKPTDSDHGRIGEWRERRREKRLAKRRRYVERQAAKGPALGDARDSRTGSYGDPPS
jgi:hypothetical protein